MTGRPTKMTNETIGKLREAFLWGCTDEEACLYANIHPDTLYAYQEINPSFSEEKSRLKMNPVLKARKAVVESLENDPQLALKFLERKKKDEFSLKQELNVSTEKLPIPIMQVTGINMIVQSDDEIGHKEQDSYIDN